MFWDGELTDLFWVGIIVLGDTQEEADLSPVERTSLSRNGLSTHKPGVQGGELWCPARVAWPGKVFRGGGGGFPAARRYSIDAVKDYSALIKVFRGHALPAFQASMKHRKSSSRGEFL